MAHISPEDAKEFRRLVHELSEALTAIGFFLGGELRRDGADKQDQVIVKAMEQVQRADRLVALMRRLADAL